MVRNSDTFIRFVVFNTNADSGFADGVFGTAYVLRDSQSITGYDHQRLCKVLHWFKAYLVVPSNFSRSKSKGAYRRNAKGLSWFKSSALLHISQMREILSILSQYGYETKQIKTSIPGYIVYEDDYQVIAEPFADTVTS